MQICGWFFFALLYVVQSVSKPLQSSVLPFETPAAAPYNTILHGSSHLSAHRVWMQCFGLWQAASQSFSGIQRGYEYVFCASRRQAHVENLSTPVIFWPDGLYRQRRPVLMLLNSQAYTTFRSNAGSHRLRLPQATIASLAIFCPRTTP